MKWGSVFVYVFMLAPNISNIGIYSKNWNLLTLGKQVKSGIN